MVLKQLVALGKIWILLLLFSNVAVAKPVSAYANPQTVKVLSLSKAQHAITKDLWHPQTGTTRLLTEHSNTPVVLGYAVLSDDSHKYLGLGYVGTTVVLVQDANRCESVSRLLFPYHIFW